MFKEELNPRNHPLTEEQSQNLECLFFSLSCLEEQYEKPLVITRGYSTPEEQEKIDPNHPLSCHTQAAACDVLDDGALWDFCIRRIDLMKDLGLYLENEGYSIGHLHLQIIPPKSGHQIFIP